jgi:hypothetical protein
MLNISTAYTYKSRAAFELISIFLSFSFVYIFCIKDGKAEKIYNEFKDSELNNRKNRIIAWSVWLITFLMPIVLILIDKKRL